MALVSDLINRHKLKTAAFPSPALILALVSVVKIILRVVF